MALTVTSLNGAITASQRQVVLTAFTNPSPGAMSADTMLLVDGEAMRVTDATYTPTLAVTRGDNVSGAATLGVAHNTLAPVIYGLTSDFAQGVAMAPVWSYGVSGAITIPRANAVVYIDKASAAAMTLADPDKDQQNTVTFTSLTAAAHTITYTTGFYDNTTSSDVATFAATAGTEPFSSHAPSRRVLAKVWEAAAVVVGT